MNTAVINVKTNPETKAKAKLVAEDMGLSLSALVNAFLTQVVKTKYVEFHVDEHPTPYLEKILKQAQEDRKHGKASQVFDSSEEVIKYLHEHGI